MSDPIKRLILATLLLMIGGQILLWYGEDWDPVASTAQRALARLELGEVSQPLDLVRNLTVRYPGRADAWAALAEVDARVGGAACVAEAQAALAQALACHDAPERLRRARRDQGLALMLAGDRENGLALLQAVANEGDAAAARALALIALECGDPAAGSRLKVAAEAMPLDDALATAIATLEGARAGAPAPADPAERDDPGGWDLLVHARWHARQHEDRLAAQLLERVRLGLAAGALTEQLPLTRVALQGDGLLSAAGAETAAAVARWPERAPWEAAGPPGR